MKILIIDYKAGNIQSVINAIAATSPESNVVVSNKIQDLRDADKIILPGVGAFNDCMEGINKVQGLKR
jgi:glutamine amidotransferase